MAPGRPGALVDEDVHHAASAVRAEFHGAGGKCEQRVVLAAADVGARVKVRSTLADDDLACADNLTAETLDAQTLRVAVASVSGAGCTLGTSWGHGQYTLCPVDMFSKNGFSGGSQWYLKLFSRQSLPIDKIGGTVGSSLAVTWSCSSLTHMVASWVAWTIPFAVSISTGSVERTIVFFSAEVSSFLDIRW